VENDVVGANESLGGHIVRIRSLPDNLVLKAFFAEHLVEHCLEVVTLLPIEVHVDTTVVSENFSQYNQSLSHKLDELCSGNLILIGFLILASPKLLLCRKRWINIDEADTKCAIGVAELSSFL